MPRNWQARRIERQQRNANARRVLMDLLVERHGGPWPSADGPAAADTDTADGTADTGTRDAASRDAASGGSGTSADSIDAESTTGRDTRISQRPLWIERRATDRRDLLVVRSELLARTADLSDRAHELIAQAGFTETVVEGLDCRVTRIYKERAHPPQVDRLKERLNDAGADARLSYVTPNMVIDKSDATPEMGRRRPKTTIPEPDPAVQVAILDTGVNDEDRTDGWLCGLQNAANRDPLDVYPPLGKLDYAAGHGSFIAGQFRQVDPELDLRAIRVLDSDGLASEVDVAVAMVRCAEEHLTEGGRLLVNLSLGTDTMQEEEPLALRVALEIIAEIQQRKRGEVMLVCAAGNQGNTNRCWPAAFADSSPDVQVVAVAALTQDHRPATWSTRGPWVTCSAVGESVQSTFVKGEEDPQVDPHPETFRKNAWARWTGTSFAAPVVGAHVAAVARKDDVSLREALARVEANHQIKPQPHPRFGVRLDL